MFRAFYLLSFAVVIDVASPLSGQDILSEWEIANQMKALRAFKVEQDARFMDPVKSPLPKDSIKDFEGLKYFPFNEKFIVEAEYRKLENGTTFEMKTTTARLPLYKDYAILRFSIDGVEYSLHAYLNIDLAKKTGKETELFIPFTDETNGEDTYGGGRYIDFTVPEKSLCILDFNRSYNPYCAYNEKYSCPVPPRENHLEIRVEAGVLKYH